MEPLNEASTKEELVQTNATICTTKLGKKHEHNTNPASSDQKTVCHSGTNNSMERTRRGMQIVQSKAVGQEGNRGTAKKKEAQLRGFAGQALL